jgi:hypothetical protein
MGQEEVLDLLEKENKPLSRTQIAEILKIDICNCSRTIKNLLTHNEIKAIEISRLEAKEMLKDNKIKRRMRLYYV